MLGQLKKYEETGVSLILLGLCIKTPWEMPLAWYRLLHYRQRARCLATVGN